MGMRRKENAMSRGGRLKNMSEILIQPTPSEGFYDALCDTLSHHFEA